MLQRLSTTVDYLRSAQERYRAEVALCMNNAAVTLQDLQRRPGSEVKLLGCGFAQSYSRG